jgi:hypothetical protein
MSMFRRSRKAAPPLHRKQQEIAQQEAQLREKVESLQRIVTQSQAPAQTKPLKRKPDNNASNNLAEKRFHVSIAMEAPQLFDTDHRRPRPRALRKERRQGQIIFLILLVALAVAVMWLISHLHLSA